MSNRKRAIDLSRFSELAIQISGPRAFSATALILASMIVSLNKISVITFSTLDPLIYVASAVILSQMIAIVFLALIGKAISRVINLVLRVTLLVSAYGISTLVANKILELLFNAWSLELVTPSTWQALISVIFSTLINSELRILKKWS